LDRVRDLGVEGGVADVFARGGEGARDLAARIVARAKSTTPQPRFAYALSDPPAEKIAKVARALYGAASVEFTSVAQRALERASELGFGDAPVCIAKTQHSLSDNEKLVGRPRDFTLTVRDVRISAGAGFLVPLTGEILTMPGLPRAPQAFGVDLRPDGTIVGVQ
jgi:formate--tetrahydrofolate ligase